MKVLMLTPWVPYPVTGADQQDRFAGIQQIRDAGHDLHIIARFHTFQDEEKIKKVFEDERVPLTLIPHSRKPWKELLKNLPMALFDLGRLDGAALEYRDPKYVAQVKQKIQELKPDVVWIEYVMLWPLLKTLKSLGIPMIVRSANNEAKQCIDDHSGSLIAKLKAIPKFVGEKRFAVDSDMVLSITPDEEKWYRSQGSTNVEVLPLRGLCKTFTKKAHEEKERLDVVFLSSNYNMGHNRDALQFLLKEIAPAVRKKLPGKITFHITGSKFPKSLEKYLADDVIYEGFVNDLPKLLSEMDAAICPWITGQGMQQKVFEPMCRSLPLLTTKVGGYPFEDGKEVLLCKDANEYAENLEKLLDHTERQRFADKAYEKSVELFSEEKMKNIASDAITSLTSG